MDLFRFFAVKCFVGFVYMLHAMFSHSSGEEHIIRFLEMTFLLAVLDHRCVEIEEMVDEKLVSCNLPIRRKGTHRVREYDATITTSSLRLEKWPGLRCVASYLA